MIPKASVKTLILPGETTASIEKGSWDQYLNFTEVNGVVYFDEGNGHQSAN